MTTVLIVAVVATMLVWVYRPSDGQIDGTWRPLFSGSGQLVDTDRPFVVFANGRWSASDGCNGTAGTFTVSQRGDLFQARVVGLRDLIGCVNVPNVEVLEQSRSVEIQPHRLTFRDAAVSITGSYRSVRTN
jgi:hypothetical protein